MTVSRRTLLQAAGRGAGALALGGIATTVTAAGNASAGEVLTFGELYQRRVPFTVTDIIQEDDKPFPQCRSAATPDRPLDGILIEYDDGAWSAIAVWGDQHVEPGSRYVFVGGPDPVTCHYDAALTVVRTAMRPLHD